MYFASLPCIAVFNSVTLNLAGSHGNTATQSSVTFVGSDNLLITQASENIKLSGVCSSGDSQGQIKFGNTNINVTGLQTTGTPEFTSATIGGYVLDNTGYSGTAEKAKALTISGGSTSVPVYFDSNGTPQSITSIDISGSVKASTFTASSDARLKENIQPYSPTSSILDLPIYKFDFINNGKKNNIGCLAQDLRKICSEIVHEDNDGYLSIEESKIVYLLLSEVKQLRKELDELRGR